MKTTTRPKVLTKPKTISIELSVEDQNFIDRLAKEYGLRKNTDCLRLALREAARRIEGQQQERIA